MRLSKRREWRPRKKSFRYEEMWERNDTLADVITNAWREGGIDADLKEVANKLTSMQDVLSRWAQREFDSVQNNIRSLRGSLQKLRLLPPSTPTATRILKVESELDEWLLREELMWKQRSRIKWLREGDKNTEFFHRKATW